MVHDVVERIIRGYGSGQVTQPETVQENGQSELLVGDQEKRKEV